MERAISLLGIVVFIGISYGFSVNRAAIRWRTVAWGLGLEFLIAIFVLKTPWGLGTFQFLGDAVSKFLGFAEVGAKFVFGDSYKDHFFAFQVLPTIIFFSAFISVLYHYRVLQFIVSGLAWVMMKTMQTSGAESLSTAGNIFLGPTESPLLVKPYVGKMTQSELFTVMTGGFATVAAGMLGLYLSSGVPREHLIAAFFMTAPTSLIIAKLLYPETEVPDTAGNVKMEVKTAYVNVIDAATTGALDGVRLAVNVGVMIIAFLGLLAVLNAFLGYLGSTVGIVGLSLEAILGRFMAPVAWLMGVPWSDCQIVGGLLGKKTILNEVLAFTDLKELIAQNRISQRGAILSTYALCNFANLGSVGITIGGITGMAPERQHDLARMGLLAMIGGLLAGFVTAAIAGVLI